jgi:hypothetical protein
MSLQVHFAKDGKVYVQCESEVIEIVTMGVVSARQMSLGPQMKLRKKPNPSLPLCRHPCLLSCLMRSFECLGLHCQEMFLKNWRSRLT